MAGGGTTGPVLDHATPTAGLLLRLVRDIMDRSGNGFAGAAPPTSGCSLFRKDCMDLVRRISLLTHFLEEIADSVGESELLDDPSRSWASSRIWCSALLAALQAAKCLLTVADEEGLEGV